MNREIKFRAWDGEKVLGYKVNGYQMRKVKWHPNSDIRGYVQEHRLIMEKNLGRYLIPRKELVHHIDGNRCNNDIINLKLSNPRDHAKGHVGTRNKNGTFICISKEFVEIKFRLFDKDRNIVQIYTLNELISKTFRKGKFEFRGRYTGLKDKNGKEIYEGDINQDGGVVVWNKDDASFCWEYKDIETSPMGEENEWCEIAGNIYENPELLTKD